MKFFCGCFTRNVKEHQGKVPHLLNYFSLAQFIQHIDVKLINPDSLASLLPESASQYDYEIVSQFIKQSFSEQYCQAHARVLHAKLGS